MSAVKIRAVWPEIPEPGEWLGNLKRTKEKNWHTNFGPLVTEFEAKLLALYGGGEMNQQSVCPTQLRGFPPV
jgi:hypothetical protein